MAPPILTKGYGYSKWKYKLEIWQVLTPWEKEKQGYPAFSFFTDQDKQAEESNREFRFIKWC